MNFCNATSLSQATVDGSSCYYNRALVCKEQSPQGFWEIILFFLMKSKACLSRLHHSVFEWDFCEKVMAEVAIAIFLYTFLKAHFFTPVLIVAQSIIRIQRWTALLSWIIMFKFRQLEQHGCKGTNWLMEGNIHVNLIYDRSGITSKWRHRVLWNKWPWENSTWKKLS